MKNKIGVKGRFSCEVVDRATNTVIFEIPDQDNLILDSWLEQSRFVPPSLKLCLGAGVVTPPAHTDTDLGNQIKQSTGHWSATNYDHVSEDATHYLEKLYQTISFTDFNGEQISELGLRSSSNGILYTRALIKDQAGNPTTITVNPGQELRITYSIYIKVPKIIGEGVISTPHGDIDWIMESIKNSGYYIRSARFNHCDYNQVRFIDRSNTYAPETVDIQNRKHIRTSTYPAKETDTIVAAGEFVVRPRNSTWWKGIALKSTAQSFTLPAYYDLTISWEMTWGRLP